MDTANTRVLAHMHGIYPMHYIFVFTSYTRYDTVMISRLTGVVVRIDQNHIVLDEHGVGYRIAVRSSLDYVLEKTVSLNTYLAVRENALDLYGFISLDELRMFEELIKLPKIGPKSALQILIQADITLLHKAINDQDPVYLSKMSGMGKKTAEKIISELKDVFADLLLNQETPAHTGDTDTIDALIALGYTMKDARDAVVKIPLEITNTNERITYALRAIGR